MARIGSPLAPALLLLGTLATLAWGQDGSRRSPDWITAPGKSSSKSSSLRSSTSQWTHPKSLPDSNDHLQWKSPQARGSLVEHPRYPSFLPALGAAPSETPAPHVNRRAGISKVSHEKPLDNHLPLAAPQPTEPPAAVPRDAARYAVPLARSRRSPEPLRLVAAQQADEADAPSDVFDDVLDELLPGGATEPDALVPPQLDRSNDALPEAMDPDLPTDDLLTVPLPGEAEPQSEPDFGLPPSAEPSDDVEAEILDDVFGDQPRSVPVPPRSETEPSDAEPTPSEWSPPTPAEPYEGVPEGLPLDVEPEAEPFEQTVPPPREPTLEPRERNPLRQDRRLPDPARDQALPLRQPGDEIVDFNGRDCPAELADLQDAWLRLRRTPIQSISLDITPSVEPNETLEMVDEPPRETMKLAPSRIWRSRQGERLTEGKMEDFRNGRVLVRDGQGQSQWLSWYDLSNEDLCFVSAWWGIPSEFSPEARAYEVRNWTMTTFTWVASALCHKPLYFEEVQLERYGHTAGPMKQAALSGAHFFGNIFFLPYHMGMNTPNECQYALGYYRPGDCAPWMVPAVPLSSRGFRWQMGALVSGLTLLP